MSDERDKLASNDNEDIAEDDVEAHAAASGSNAKDGASKDDLRERLAANDNEDVAADE